MRFRSAKDLTPADVGRRVTVRRRLPDGRASDVIGILSEVDEAGVTILRDDGSVDTISGRDIVAARVIG